MKAIELVQACAEVLQDEGYADWRPEQLFGWLNDALAALTLFRPDAHVQTLPLELEAGTLQRLPGNTTRLMAVLYNMDVDGKPGLGVRGPVDPTALLAADPQWHQGAGAATVTDYTYSPEDPRVFYVYPGVAVGARLQARLATPCDPIGDGNDPLPVSDVYAPALIEWMLYRAFSRDSEETPNYARGINHQKAFFALLGVKAPADQRVAPRVINETARIQA